MEPVVDGVNVTPNTQLPPPGIVRGVLAEVHVLSGVILKSALAGPVID